MNKAMVELLPSATWDSSLFPGFREFLEMLAYAFWWETAFALAAIPLFIVLVVAMAVLQR